MKSARVKKAPKMARPSRARSPAPPAARTISLLPRLAADLFARMTDEEKLAFLQLVGPETLEEWLATLELSGADVDELLERARREIEAGLENEVPL